MTINIYDELQKGAKPTELLDRFQKELQAATAKLTADKQKQEEIDRSRTELIDAVLAYIVAIFGENAIDSKSAEAVEQYLKQCEKRPSLFNPTFATINNKSKANIDKIFQQLINW